MRGIRIQIFQIPVKYGCALFCCRRPYSNSCVFAVEEFHWINRWRNAIWKLPHLESSC